MKEVNGDVKKEVNEDAKKKVIKDPTRKKVIKDPKKKQAIIGLPIWIPSSKSMRSSLLLGKRA